MLHYTSDHFDPHCLIPTRYRSGWRAVLVIYSLVSTGHISNWASSERSTLHAIPMLYIRTWFQPGQSFQTGVALLWLPYLRPCFVHGLLLPACLECVPKHFTPAVRLPDEWTSWSEARVISRSLQLKVFWFESSCSVLCFSVFKHCHT